MTREKNASTQPTDELATPSPATTEGEKLYAEWRRWFGKNVQGNAKPTFEDIESWWDAGGDLEHLPLYALFVQWAEEQSDTLVRELAAAREVLGKLPVARDGLTLGLNRTVYVVRAMARCESKYGYGHGPLDQTSPIITCRVASIGILGEKNRLCTFIEDGASFTFSADLRAVYSTRSAAEAAGEG